MKFNFDFNVVPSIADITIYDKHAYFSKDLINKFNLRNKNFRWGIDKENNKIAFRIVESGRRMSGQWVSYPNELRSYIGQKFMVVKQGENYVLNKFEI